MREYPVDDGDAVHEAVRHRDVRDVRRPDLVGAHDLDAAEQVRVLLVRRVRLRRRAPRLQAFHARQPHQPLHALAADPVTDLAQPLTRDIAVQELVDALEKGWELERHANGVATVSREVFVRLSYEEMGQRLGLTARQVHRRVAAANKKLRSATP